MDDPASVELERRSHYLSSLIRRTKLSTAPAHLLPPVPEPEAALIPETPAGAGKLPPPLGSETCGRGGEASGQSQGGAKGGGAGGERGAGGGGGCGEGEEEGRGEKWRGQQGEAGRRAQEGVGPGARRRHVPAPAAPRDPARIRGRRRHAAPRQQAPRARAQEGMHVTHPASRQSVPSSFLLGA
jgi:hypothetical protein